MQCDYEKQWKSPHTYWLECQWSGGYYFEHSWIWVDYEVMWPIIVASADYVDDYWFCKRNNNMPEEQ